ncbi:MAG TPA: hypothetical protein VG498_16880 [Terriglobales bacterium]|nr:hypothetical protein [Terriglobales bacterium]
MIRITCDTCGAVKAPQGRDKNREWILGYDIELESPRSLQHSIRFLDRWDNRRINELGAIHFCSLECKDKYMRRSAAA